MRAQKTGKKNEWSGTFLYMVSVGKAFILQNMQKMEANGHALMILDLF